MPQIKEPNISDAKKHVPALRNPGKKRKKNTTMSTYRKNSRIRGGEGV